MIESASAVGDRNGPAQHGQDPLEEAGQRVDAREQRFHAALSRVDLGQQLDPEEFHDFTESRPEVSLQEGLVRRIDWPAHTLSAAVLPGGGPDLVLLTAVEPQLRWRTYCATVVEVARALGCEMVLTLGSLLADMPHTRPVRITGTVGSPELAEELGLSQSRYEGPTGIVGVLHDALRTAGVRSASLWASVPHYVGRSPSPSAALALVERAAPILGIDPDVTSLQIEAVQYLSLIHI